MRSRTPSCTQIIYPKKSFRFKRLTWCHTGLLLFASYMGTILQLGCSSERWTEGEFADLLNSPEQLERTLQTMSPTEQDLLLLSLAVRSPYQAPHLCKKVKAQAAVEKCKQVIGRPHLQLSEPQINDVDAQSLDTHSVKSNKER